MHGGGVVEGVGVLVVETVEREGGRKEKKKVSGEYWAEFI